MKPCQRTERFNRSMANRQIQRFNRAMPGSMEMIQPVEQALPAVTALAYAAQPAEPRGQSRWSARGGREARAPLAAKTLYCSTP